jgi:hypothetical protein
MKQKLRAAGFVEVAANVRHFLADDTPISSVLAKRLAALRDERVLHRIGRIGGWYVVATGRKPR